MALRFLVDAMTRKFTLPGVCFVASLPSQRQFIEQVDSSVGYFADAQYDALDSGIAAVALFPS